MFSLPLTTWNVRDSSTLTSWKCRKSTDPPSTIRESGTRLAMGSSNSTKDWGQVTCRLRRTGRMLGGSQHRGQVFGTLSVPNIEQITMPDMRRKRFLIRDRQSAGFGFRGFATESGPGRGERAKQKKSLQGTTSSGLLQP